MQKLLSLPPNLVQSFHELERVNRTDWFCTSDPVGKKTWFRWWNILVA